MSLFFRSKNNQIYPKQKSILNSGAYDCQFLYGISNLSPKKFKKHGFEKHCIRR